MPFFKCIYLYYFANLFMPCDAHTCGIDTQCYACTNGSATLNPLSKYPSDEGICPMF